MMMEMISSARSGFRVLWLRRRNWATSAWTLASLATISSVVRIWKGKTRGKEALNISALGNKKEQFHNSIDKKGEKLVLRGRDETRARNEIKMQRPKRTIALPWILSVSGLKTKNNCEKKLFTRHLEAVSSNLTSDMWYLLRMCCAFVIKSSSLYNIRSFLKENVYQSCHIFGVFSWDNSLVCNRTKKNTIVSLTNMMSGIFAKWSDGLVTSFKIRGSFSFIARFLLEQNGNSVHSKQFKLNFWKSKWWLCATSAAHSSRSSDSPRRSAPRAEGFSCSLLSTSFILATSTLQEKKWKFHRSRALCNGAVPVFLPTCSPEIHSPSLCHWIPFATEGQGFQALCM